MDYITHNKAAWEEAFNHRTPGWGENVPQNIQADSAFYIHPGIRPLMDTLDLSGKTIAQFCCNNGREILSVCKHYNMSGVGFDIAQNLIDQANAHNEHLKQPCSFVCKNILEINSSYYDSFDMVLFTIGAITWFENLDLLFRVASKCLKPGGIIILHDFHPFMNMLPLPGEAEFMPDATALLEHKYFSKEPWIENNGVGYISGDYPSKTLISFSHSLSNIITHAIQNNMAIRSFAEFDYDVGLTDAYDNKGLPLSFLLSAQRQ